MKVVFRMAVGKPSTKEFKAHCGASKQRWFSTSEQENVRNTFFFFTANLLLLTTHMPSQHHSLIALTFLYLLVPVITPVSPQERQVLMNIRQDRRLHARLQVTVGIETSFV